MTRHGDTLLEFDSKAEADKAAAILRRETCHACNKRLAARGIDSVGLCERCDAECMRADMRLG